MGTTYTILANDSDKPSPWMSLCDTCSPRNQADDRVRYDVTTERAAELEAALEEDDGVLEYVNLTARAQVL